MRFPSGHDVCAGWHYPGTNGACVIMAAGLGVTKEPGTDLFAKRFAQAGFAVFAFDYRRFGESGGQPRQIARVREQHADWDAAIAFASTLADVNPARIAVWGFSSSGGHVFTVAARHPQLAAAIAQSPLVDGPTAMPNALRHQKPIAFVRFSARAGLDACLGLLGRGPLLVPLAGAPGVVTSLTTPNSLNGARALNPKNRYPDWQQQIAARSALRFGLYRPGRYAPQVRCPMLVLVHEDDGVVLTGPAARAAQRLPRGELAHLPGGHYAALTDGHEQAAEAQLSFLTRHLLEPLPSDPAPGRPR